MLQQGLRVDGYRVRARIGEGGLSAVYEVVHETLGSRHALKVLEVVSPEARGRLLREGRAQARVHHPNLVAVSDVIQIADRPALVLEYVDGPTLEALLEEGRPPLAVALGLFRGIVQGVDAAHRAGLVHRDLKPSNVLLARTPSGLLPKVTDFGLAKALDDSDTELSNDHGGVRGTPEYMAPEQHRGEVVDLRADLFALGCILYELVTGRRPFDGPDLLTVATAACHGGYAPPDEVVRDLPREVTATIRALLQPRPEHRLASCDQILLALDGGTPPALGSRSFETTMSLDEVPTPVRAASAAKRPPPVRRRSFAGPALVGASLLAVAIAVGVAISVEPAPTAPVVAAPADLPQAAPVVEPPPPAESSPAPAAPAPRRPPAVVPGRIAIAGDGAVTLLDSAGAEVAAGPLPPGTYRWRATLGNTDVDGEIVLAPGETVTLTCASFAMRCRVTR